MRPATAATLPTVRCANASAFAGCNIGVPCSPLEAVTSLDPKDYVWGAPSPQQQQLLFQQFLQLHFLHHFHMSQHNPALAGAPIPMLLHPSQVPTSHLAAAQCALIPGLSAMPGFLAAGPHLVAHQLPAAPSQPAAVPSHPMPSQTSSKTKASAKQVVVKKEEPVMSSKTSTAPAPKATLVPAVKSPAPEHPSSATLDSAVNSADSVLSYLDKDEIFDCMGDFHMDMFDVMLSEHDYELQSGINDQASALSGAASIPSPSGSDNSNATVAGVADTAVTTPTSNETLSFLEADVSLLPLPADGPMSMLDYTADFKDVADFEFTDLDEIVGLAAADLSRPDQIALASAPGTELSCDPGAGSLGGGSPESSALAAKQLSRPVKVKKGSGVQKPTNRRCHAKSMAAKNLLPQAI